MNEAGRDMCMFVMPHKKSVPLTQQTVNTKRCKRTHACHRGSTVYAAPRCASTGLFLSRSVPRVSNIRKLSVSFFFTAISLQTLRAEYRPQIRWCAFKRKRGELCAPSRIPAQYCVNTLSKFSPPQRALELHQRPTLPLTDNRSATPFSRSL